MAILRNKELKNMDEKIRNEKLKELRLELVKAKVGSQKASAKTKEIKRAIARILTFNNATTTKSGRESNKQ
jgi:ribosomal protein L29